MKTPMKLKPILVEDVVWFKMDREGRRGKGAQESKSPSKAARLPEADENAADEDSDDAEINVLDDSVEEEASVDRRRMRISISLRG